jgi:hypothetical protein
LASAKFDPMDGSIVVVPQLTENIWNHRI